MDTTVLIPAFRPDHGLLALAAALAPQTRLVVVDDGSGPDFAPLFKQLEELPLVLLRHGENRGKGAAIKTGLAYILSAGGGGVITADADGQHSAQDILRVREAMEAHPGVLVLGARDIRRMPPRSRVGNTITGFFFRLMTGLHITDTQTGLRGFPESMLPWLLQVQGDRYEYEMNMLLALKAHKAPYMELPIDTIYIEQNASSHFHALRDGFRVFSRLFKYSAVSLSCMAVDFALYSLLLLWIPPKESYVAARAVSSTLNYQLNRRVVFHAKPSFRAAAGYVLLVLCIMLLGSQGVHLLAGLGLQEVVAKVLVDCLLFFLNYLVQNRILFCPGRRKKGGPYTYRP